MLKSKSLLSSQSNMFYLIQTDLAKAADVTVTDRTETSLTVNVTEAPGNWKNFSVNCEPASSKNNPGTATCIPPDTCTCGGLTSGEKYTIKVYTTRTGFTPVKSDREDQDVTGIIIIIIIIIMC